MVLLERHELNSYFQSALSDFTNDVASGGAIRHLADLGYTAKQITERLDFPTPYERVRQEMWKYLVDRGVILLEEPGSRKRETAVYVREVDQYGRSSFRRVLEPAGAQTVAQWRVRQVETADIRGFRELLREKRNENGEDCSYLSCDFGPVNLKEPLRYRQIMRSLDDAQREYIEGLPWGTRRVYHRIDERMFEIVARLSENGSYSGECFFLKSGEKWKL